MLATIVVYVIDITEAHSFLAITSQIAVVWTLLVITLCGSNSEFVLKVNYFVKDNIN